MRAIRDEVDLLRDDAVTDWIRLRGRRRLARLLRHGSLLDTDQRLAGHAVEDVGPPGLGDLNESLHRLAVDLRVEQYDRIRGVIVPDVVMNLLEVPTVLARLGLDREDRHREQIVARSHVAVQIGRGITGREIQQPETWIDCGRLPDRGPAMSP